MGLPQLSPLAVARELGRRASPAPVTFVRPPRGPEPLRGKEIHVRFEGIVTTEPYANVRVCLAQTTGVNPGHGRTRAERTELIRAEADELRREFLKQAENLRSALTEGSPIVPASIRNRMSRRPRS